MNGVEAVQRSFVYSEDLIPLWELALQKIVEVVIRVLIPLAVVLLCHALALTTALLVIITLGAVFSTGLLFSPRTPHKVECAAREVLRAEQLPVQGIKNRGQNCWLNVDLQLIESDEALMRMIRNAPLDFPREALFATPERLFTVDELQAVPQRVAIDWPAPLPNTDSEILRWVQLTPEMQLIPVESILKNEIPNWFWDCFPPEEREIRYRNAAFCMPDLHKRLLKSPELCDKIHALQQEPQVQFIDRLNALWYARFFQTLHLEKREGMLNLLLELRRFYDSEDRDSQRIREILHTLQRSIAPFSWVSDDPVTPLGLFLDFMPCTIEVEKTLHEESGLIRKSREIGNGHIPVAMGSKTTQEAVDRFMNEKISLMVNGARVQQIELQYVAPPPSLWVQLKRSNNQLKKLDQPIDLSEVLSINTLNGSMLYSLDAFAVHVGSGIQGGHYVAYILTAGQWYRCSDQNISRVSPKDLEKAKKQAVLVHYQ